jgi:hypothetical protein
MLKACLVVCALGVPWAVFAWLFQDFSSLGAAVPWFLGVAAINVGIAVSGWKLLRSDEDVCKAGGFTFLFFGAAVLGVIVVTAPIGMLLHEKVLCLGPLVAFDCAMTSWLLAFRVYFSLGVRGLLDM